MKYMLFVTVIVLFSVFIAGCGSSNSQIENLDEQNSTNQSVIDATIANMTLHNVSDPDVAFEVVESSLDYLK